MKKIQKNLNQILKWFCVKFNWHSYRTMFSGYPAFSNSWYKVKVCRHCRKTKLEYDNKTKPEGLEFNINYINYNKTLNSADKILAKQMVYEMNRSFRKGHQQITLPGQKN